MPPPMMITRLAGCDRGSSPSSAVATTSSEMGGVDSGGGAPDSWDSAVSTASDGSSVTFPPRFHGCGAESTG